MSSYLSLSSSVALLSDCDFWCSEDIKYCGLGFNFHLLERLSFPVLVCEMPHYGTSSWCCQKSFVHNHYILLSYEIPQHVSLFLLWYHTFFHKYYSFNVFLEFFKLYLSEKLIYEKFNLVKYAVSARGRG